MSPVFFKSGTCRPLYLFMHDRGESIEGYPIYSDVIPNEFRVKIMGDDVPRGRHSSGSSIFLTENTRPGDTCEISALSRIIFAVRKRKYYEEFL